MVLLYGGTNQSQSKGIRKATDLAQNFVGDSEHEESFSIPIKDEENED